MSGKAPWPGTLPFLGFLLFDLLLCAAPAPAATPAPTTIGFTGLLNDKTGKPLDGDIPVHLALYDAPDPAVTTPLWSDDKTVHATHGLFSTALGDHTAFPASLDFSQALFVGVSVNGEPEMQPRLALQSVPYALFAQKAAALKTPIAQTDNAPYPNAVVSVTNTANGQALSGINTSPSSSAIGVFGLTQGGSGVQGEAQAGGAVGVAGYGLGLNGIGIAGTADTGVQAAGLYGESLHGRGLYAKTTDGMAAQFDGTTLFNGQVGLGSGREIYFRDAGQIRSFDDNHRILFRRGENKLELREWGDLIFSPGSSSGQETDKVVMLGNGDVGIGTAIPAGLVDVMAAPNGPGGQMVDQQQLLNESYGGLGPGSTLGQSFIAGATGRITRIDLDIVGFNNAAFTGTLSLYAGASPTGTPIGTYNISGAAGPASWRPSYFSPGFAVTAGQPYTWVVTVTGTAGITILATQKNGYPYGLGYMNGTPQGGFDFAFRTYVTVPSGPTPTHALTIDPYTANVGIGTATPASALDVLGDVTLGQFDRYHAVGSLTPLALYAAVIDSTGNIISGVQPTAKGITCAHTGTGTYHITINVQFDGLPVPVVTPFNGGTSAAAGNLSVQSVGTSFDVFTYKNNALVDSAFSLLIATPRY